MPEQKPSYPLHPVTVHFPLALFPASFAAEILYRITGSKMFDAGSFVMLLFALLSVPITASSGLLDWKTRYKGYMTRIFKIKISGAVLLLLLALPTSLMRSMHTQLAFIPSQWQESLHLALLTSCCIVGAVVGYYGGKLIYHH